MARGKGRARAGRQGQSGRHRPPARRRPGARPAGRKHQRFARGLPANNALLWGARGMGKSSLVKAAQAAINRRPGVEGSLKLVEIHREDIEGLPALMTLLRDAPCRFIVFCDDLSFDADDASYKSLKAALEGGVEGRPANVLFYATSNRRHLMPREMMENERVERHQSRRGGRGEGFAVRPFRPVARLPSLQPGRLSRHGARLRRAFRAERPGGRKSRRRRWNGRRRAARARAAPPGSSSRIWRDASANRSPRLADDRKPRDAGGGSGGPQPLKRRNRMRIDIFRNSDGSSLPCAVKAVQRDALPPKIEP